MKKITYPIFSFILLIFINGCAGYEPIFSSTNLQFEIADYSIEGNKILGNKIYSRLYSLSKSEKDDLNLRSIELAIKVSKNKNATAKNSAGTVLTYKINLSTAITVKDFITDNQILSESFVLSSSYKVQDQHSETLKLENRSIENLINKTYQDILIKLSENIL